VALACTSGVVVSHEVLLTRLLSVVTWYGLGFFVLSLAMLGLTAGALVARRSSEQGTPLGPFLGRHTIVLALSIVVSVVAVLKVPLSSVPSATALAALIVVAAAAALPMAAGGAVVTRLMSELDAPIGWVYAVDLAGAAVGALAPVVLLGPLTGPAAALFLAAVAAGVGALVVPRGIIRSLSIAVAVALALGTFVNGRSPLGLAVSFSKGRVVTNDPAAYIFDAWNALSNVRVERFKDVPMRDALWAPSARTPAGTVKGAFSVIDGEAGTYVYKYRDLADLDFLRYDVTNVAHWLRPDGQACVMGVGGGRDLLSALVFGHSAVLGVEVNPLFVDMLAKVRTDSPVLADPRVRIVVGDGRSVLSHEAPRCRTLQASLVDTWAATGAGAFAHAEGTLYTREAWAQFLKRVEPDGVLTFSRWFSPRAASETSRLASLAMAALLDRGTSEPERHLAIVTGGNVATLVLSPAPLSPSDLATLHERAGALDFDVLLAPDKLPDDPTLRRIVGTRSVARLADAGLPRDLDTSAPDDDRPFFFQLLSPRMWLHPMRLRDKIYENAYADRGVIGGNILATLQFLETMAAVLLVALGALGPALWREARRNALPGPRAAVYFAALGAGFMLAEIALVQRMHVALGHPTYALVVVLAGLLVSTGVGSALSARVAHTRGAVSAVAATAGVLLVLLPHVAIGPLARLTEASALGTRALWAGAVSGLVGVCLGTLFPSGVRFIARDRGVPLALALNGAASVLGGVFAVVFSVALGISATFALAGALYLVAAWAGPRGWPTPSA
jgi:hypothetical protein